MDKKVLKKYVKAGEILRTMQKTARKSIKPGQKLIDIAKEIENGIKKKGGEPAFPVNLSVNNNAAHYTPSADDETVLAGSDVLKVDIGVHVGGYIADAAFTLDFSGKHWKMVEASEKALADAVKVVEERAFGNGAKGGEVAKKGKGAKNGLKLEEIGKAVQGAINACGFKPIQNLSGHGLGQWKAHASPSIPNIEKRDERVLEEGAVFAIEPFATDGRGFVKDAPQSEIFGIDEPRPVRRAEARKAMEFIMEKYHTLPFAERWLMDELGMSEFKRRVALRELLRTKCIKAFPILREEPGKIVTQAETSIALADGKVVVLV